MFYSFHKVIFCWWEPLSWYDEQLSRSSWLDKWQHPEDDNYYYDYFRASERLRAKWYLISNVNPLLLLAEACLALKQLFFCKPCRSTFAWLDTSLLCLDSSSKFLFFYPSLVFIQKYCLFFRNIIIILNPKVIFRQKYVP